MQATTISIPNNLATAEFSLDRTELMRLQEMGVVTGKAYIYLALKLTYKSAAFSGGRIPPERCLLNISIDTESFCEDWQVTESDLAIALGQLQKKGALAPVHRQLELELY